jgi:hypothetical protein
MGKISYWVDVAESSHDCQRDFYGVSSLIAAPLLRKLRSGAEFKLGIKRAVTAAEIAARAVLGPIEWARCKRLG